MHRKPTHKFHIIIRKGDVSTNAEKRNPNPQKEVYKKSEKKFKKIKMSRKKA